MTDKIRKVLEAAILAPSGSNSQPWTFSIDGNQVTIFAEYEKDHPILNYRNRGTLIAHGALLENIYIASEKYGLVPEIKIFPEANNDRVIIKIVFTESLPREHLLFGAIEKRTTNRKAYSRNPLKPELKEKLLRVGEDFPNLEFKLEERPEKLKLLGEAASINEVVTLENKELHRLFFKEINWTEQEDKEKGTGFFLKTMELDPMKLTALKLLKNWKVMNFFNKIKFARGIAKSNASTYSSTGAIGVITTRNEDLDFLEAGRLMERVWLEATLNGLSFHLITGILYFWQRLENIGLEVNEENKSLIRSAYSNISEVFSVEEGRIVSLMFRIGEDGQPSAYSRRIALDKLIKF